MDENLLLCGKCNALAHIRSHLKGLTAQASNPDSGMTCHPLSKRQPMMKDERVTQG